VTEEGLLVTEPEEGAFVSGRALVVRGTVSGLSGGRVLVDGRLATRVGDAFEVELPQLREGARTLLVQWLPPAARAADGVRQLRRTIFVDDTPPRIDLHDVSYVPGAIGKVRGLGQVVDASPATFHVSGHPFALDREGMFDIEIDVHRETAGEVKLELAAVDQVGHRGVLEALVDIVPYVRVVTPARPAVPEREVRWRIECAHVAPDTVLGLRIRQEGGGDTELGLVPVVGTVGMWEAVFTFPADGRYAIDVMAVDAQDRASTLMTLPGFLVDTTPPELADLRLRLPVGTPGWAVEGTAKDRSDVHIVVDSGERETLAAPGTATRFFIPLGKTPPGIRIEVAAQDDAGHLSRGELDLRQAMDRSLLPRDLALDPSASQRNQALELDGTSGLRLSIGREEAHFLPVGGYGSVLPRTFTIECWAQSADAGPGQVLLAKGTGAGVALWWAAPPLSEIPGSRPAQADLYDRSPGVSAFARLEGPSFVPGVWHHVALCFDGSNASLFVDGRLRRAMAVAQFAQDATRLTVGGQLSGGKQQAVMNGFRGEIDDLRVSRIVRYTEPFEPPAKLRMDPDTLLLLDFETLANGLPVVRAPEPYLAEGIGGARIVPSTRPGAR